MIAKDVTDSALQESLDAVNNKHGGNLTWHAECPPEPLNSARTRFKFRLSVFSAVMGDGSTGNFARRGIPWDGDGAGRRIKAACWHAHGLFFDELFKRCPDAVVSASGRTLTADDHWPDWEIGPRARPLMLSQACDCEEREG